MSLLIATNSLGRFESPAETSASILHVVSDPPKLVGVSLDGFEHLMALVFLLLLHLLCFSLRLTLQREVAYLAFLLKVLELLFEELLIVVLLLLFLFVLFLFRSVLGLELLAVVEKTISVPLMILVPVIQPVPEPVEVLGVISVGFAILDNVFDLIVEVVLSLLAGSDPGVNSGLPLLGGLEIPLLRLVFEQIFTLHGILLLVKGGLPLFGLFHFSFELLLKLLLLLFSLSLDLLELFRHATSGGSSSNGFLELLLHLLEPLLI